MLNAVKYRFLLHACQGSFEFFYTLSCKVEVLPVSVFWRVVSAEGSFQKNASVDRLIPCVSDRNSLLWFSLSCIRCVLMCLKSFNANDRK